ncbi:rhodanese-like domain-containing protein [Gymnodinialimonas sp. 2305UL16-5]|uniref:rhodanese-like domain-containing protein n=1 Tax=Gymnodinialimonas mytili TaxID=3126503 RepID=UPI003099BA94
MIHTFPTLTPKGLLSAMASETAPCLLDVRLAEDIADPARYLPGALAVPHQDTQTLQALAARNGAVVICHKGLKISAGVTARLRNAGVNAWRLEGGHIGWIDAGFPVLTEAPNTVLAPLAATPAETAQIWAIARFRVPMAEMLAVPRADLLGVAQRFDAVAFSDIDIPDLPGLHDLLAQASLSALFGAQCAAASDPRGAFPHLDAAYRGWVCHETFTPNAATQAICAGKEQP